MTYSSAGYNSLFSMLVPFSCIFFPFLLNPVLGLYGSGDDVVQLTSSNFDKLYSSDGVWFVEFYAPWCGHCKNLAPEWKRAATILKGIVTIAAVNAEENQQLANKFGIQGFPTILMFTRDKSSTPSPYNGERHHAGIVNEALRQVKLLAESRMGGRPTDSGDSSHSDVIELTDSNFDETVLQSTEPWLVEFYAPWCGYCKSLKPHWERAASELKGTVKVGAVDATVHNRLAKKYQINGFPTIKFFPAGSKQDDPVNYDGGRTSSDIVTWAQDKSEALLPVPKVIELTSADALKHCSEDHPICVISVLPDLYDCQSECRNRYLNLLKEHAGKHKKQKWGWLWAPALRQSDLEKKFNIEGSGYPAMVALHGKKMKYTSLRGAFSTEGIHDFLRSLLLGDPNMHLFTLQSMPTIEKIEPWDGKDAPPLEPEEEINLSDLDLKLEL